MCQIFISTRPGNRYTPPSTSTLRNKLIPAEAAQVTLNCRQILQHERNITLSFDGLTKGKQSLYTVHAITGDCLVFLYKGDVIRGSHNSNYIYKLLNEVSSVLKRSMVKINGTYIRLSMRLESPGLQPLCPMIQIQPRKPAVISLQLTHLLSTLPIQSTR